MIKKKRSVSAHNIQTLNSQAVVVVGKSLSLKKLHKAMTEGTTILLVISEITVSQIETIATETTAKEITAPAEITTVNVTNAHRLHPTSKTTITILPAITIAATVTTRAAHGMRHSNIPLGEAGTAEVAAIVKGTLAKGSQARETLV